MTKKTLLLFVLVMVFTWRGKADPFRFENETRRGPSAFQAEGGALFLMKGRGNLFPKGKKDEEDVFPLIRRHDFHMAGKADPFYFQK